MIQQDLGGNKKEEQAKATQENSSENTSQVPPKQGEKIRLGFRIANAVAAIVAFSLAIANIVTQVVRGELTGIASIAQSGIVLMFRASNLVVPFTNFRDKFIEKLESTKVGKVFSRSVATVWKTLTSKPAKRFYRIGMAALTMLISPTPVGIALASLSLAAIAYNVAKESLEVHDAKRLMQEHRLLKNNVELKQKQKELLKQLDSSSSFQKFIEQHEATLGPRREAAELRITPKTSKVGEVAKALRDNALEGVSLIGNALTADNPVDQAMAAFVTLGNVTGEADKNLQKRKEKYAVQRANDELQVEIGQYKSLEELKTLEREERIRTEALTRFAKEVEAGKLPQEPGERFEALRKEVALEPDFAAPKEKTFFEKMTFSVASGTKYVIQSQFDSTSNLYQPEQIGENVAVQEQTASANTAQNKLERAASVADMVVYLTEGGERPKSIAAGGIKIGDIKPSPTPKTPHSKVVAELKVRQQQHSQVHNR